MSIEIPELGIRQKLTELAVIGRDLQVPDAYSDVGWWRDGPWPGQKGAAVVVGHVDSPTGPAVFYRLSSLKPGDRIEVHRAKGVTFVFEVKDVKVYDKTKFPTKRVYRSSGRPALHLLTCGGTFNTESKAYSSNVVVYAPLLKKITKQAPDKKPQTKKAAGKRQ